MSVPLPSTLRVHASMSEVPRALWDGLVGPDGSPFLTWAWLSALEESGSAVPETGWTPRHLTLWRGSRLVAAAPAYLKAHSHGEYVYDWAWASAAEQLGVAYFPKLVLGVPFTPATGRRALVAPGPEAAALERELYGAALEYARAEGLSGVHVLFPTAAETATLSALGYGVRLGVQYHWQREQAASFEDYLGRFTARRRHQVRRERRALTEQGLTLHTLEGEALQQVPPAEAFALYASTLERYPGGRRFLTPAFFTRLWDTQASRLVWVEARAGGERVAGALNVLGPDVLYGRHWGTTRRLPFLHFDVCLYRGVEETAWRGLSRFEPGAGGEHKLVRGFLPTLTYSAHALFPPRLARAVGAFLVQERTAILQGLPRWRADSGLKG